MYDRLKEFKEPEIHATLGTDYLIRIRGYKQKDMAASMGTYVTTLSNLLNSKLNWNFTYLDGVCRFLQVEPDELLRTGRVLNSAPSAPAGMPELSGPKAGSRERFALIWGAASAGSLVGRLYTADRLRELVPSALEGYGKGRITDSGMSLACRSLVSRLGREPEAEVWRVFGLLEG